MTDAVALGQAKETKEALLLGLARAPLPGDKPLAALSLVAMRDKFMRPRPPASTPETSVPYQPNPRHLSEQSRFLLLKLISGQDGDRVDGIAFGVLRTINARGLKLHPLDYARLENFIARYTADLGPEERAWLNLVRPERTNNREFDIDAPLTQDTLPQASKVQKIEYLRALRNSDPTKARELIETLSPNEPANVRADLIRLLEIKLDAGDRPFLESLASDRAQSVREVANELLGCISGSEPYAKRVERLKDHVQVKIEGLIRKHKLLKCVGQFADDIAVQRAVLKGLHLKDIAATLGLTEHELLEAASRSEKIGMLPLLFLTRAVNDGLLDLAADYVALLEGERFVDEFLAETLPSARASDRDRILRLAFRPTSWTCVPSSTFLRRLSELVGTLPLDLAGELLDAPASTSEADEMSLASVAPLIPLALSDRFIAKSESVARRAALYHRFLLSLPDHDS
jgi:hypothetical protein